MNLKSFVLCGIMLPCAMAILACSDSETSNPIANGPTGAFVGVKYHMTLDEANQNFLLNRTYNQDVCIRQNEQYEFTTIVGSSYAERDYAFIGDTLVTFNKKYQEDYGEVFVGGTNGQIRNKWRLMNECRFIPESNSIKCATAEELGSKALHTITYYERSWIRKLKIKMNMTILRIHTICKIICMLWWRYMRGLCWMALTILRNYFLDPMWMTMHKEMVL